MATVQVVATYTCQDQGEYDALLGLYANEAYAQQVESATEHPEALTLVITSTVQPFEF